MNELMNKLMNILYLIDSQGFKVLSKSAEIVSREYCKSDFRSSRELSLTTNRYQLIDIIGGESGLKPIELKVRLKPVMKYLLDNSFSHFLFRIVLNKHLLIY
jgi:hypothetical protein